MLSWSDETAERYILEFGEYGEDIALRVYTSRMLGKNPALVLHGGGNTSVKTVIQDRFGCDREVLCVKGSGWDLGEIKPKGLPAVDLVGLRRFRDLVSMSDEEMVSGVRSLLLDPSSPNPSVETLLHAFLPHKFIDHTHADSVLALADQPDAERVCREVFGDRFGYVPYIMPGFDLAKKAAEVYERGPEVEGLILLGHGIFTFGETAREAYERMNEAVSTAGNYIREQGNTLIHNTNVPKPIEDRLLTRYLGIIRGVLGGHSRGIGRQVLEWRFNRRIDAFLSNPGFPAVALRGPVTPDHIIRTKQKPLVFEILEEEDDASFRARFSEAVDQFVAEYDAYFDRQTESRNLSRTRLHPLPIVFLVPGVGLITSGKSRKDAMIAADIYEHTMDVILDAEAIGRYQALPESDLFDMEYWSLEQAKLGKKAPAPLAGHVVLITGAAGAIGAATARCFAALGANLVLTDMEADRLAGLVKELQEKKADVAALVCDLTLETKVRDMVQAAARGFGGFDLVVSNAGRAFTGDMDHSSEALAESLKVNLMSHQHVASHAMRLFKQQATGGCLLFNASKSAFNPGPGFGPYSIAKAAVIALMKQYAVEGSPFGVRASAVNADRIRGGVLSDDLVTERAKARGVSADQYFRANLLRREVRAEDVAQAFLFLYQAESTTAGVFTVDGGNVAASPR